jgi:uncharacterized membrane protein YdjX (TVP38/TMEM64 family)
MLAIKALRKMPASEFRYYRGWGYGKSLWIFAMILGSTMVPAAFTATLIWGAATGGAVLAGFVAATGATIQEFLAYCWSRNMAWRRLEARRVEARRIERILAERRYEREIEERWERENAAMAA